MQHLLLIDANSLIHRAYHAMPKDMQNSQGEITGAVFGFTKAILQSIKDLKPTHIAAAFDLAAPTFRHQKYEAYKAGREGMDKNLSIQIPRIKNILTVLNIPCFEKEGFEADDLVGTLASQASKHPDMKTTIVTGDLDALQLIKDEKVAVWTPTRGDYKSVIYNEEAVKNRYGFGPEYITDYKALRGDPSDNIPGVSGIGEKTAALLIQKIGSVEKIYQQLKNDEIPQDVISGRLKEKLKADKKMAFLSKELATIDRYSPIKLTIDECRVNDYDREQVESLFTLLEFKSLIKELPPTIRLSKTSSSLFNSENEKKSQSEKIDRDLGPILRKMENKGIKIDCHYLRQLETKYQREIVELTTKIYNFSGTEFNLDSPSQLSHVLYEKLSIPTQNLKIGKAGHFPTDAATLEKFIKISPVAILLLKYRQLSKLLNTYIKPLPLIVDKIGRIHTSYAPDTTSGRISSREPNLQNIPVRTDCGREIRKAFIAEPKHILLSADYSQIELRIVAHLADDKNMIESFINQEDIHLATSKRMKVDRRIAKIINFSLLYGKQAYGLAEDLKISRHEAQEFIDLYFNSFPKIKGYITKTIEETRTNGFAKTLFGKKRTFPDILSENQFRRAAAEREAVNHPIQGTAAEILKLAMIDVDKHHLSDYMVLSVHDELVFEIEESKVDVFKTQIKEIMEGVIKLKVPLEVDINIGQNWGQLK